MTLQQLRYIVAVAELGSITEAAKSLYISQPSLSHAIKALEHTVGITIFIRNRAGITVTQEGKEFLGYARQVLQQMELLENKYISAKPTKIQFGVSAHHYTFTENAFVDLVKRFGQECYEFYFNATATYQILEDVKNQVSQLGVIYLSESNQSVMQQTLAQNHLQFFPLFQTAPHVFLQKNHPLAQKSQLQLEDLTPFPRLNFVQGNYESVYFAEELFSHLPTDKQIRINDRGAIVNFMLGLNAYTISSGIYPKYLHGDNIIAIPLNVKEKMTIGYILNKNQPLCDLGKAYIRELQKYAPNGNQKID